MAQLQDSRVDAEGGKEVMESMWAAETDGALEEGWKGMYPVASSAGVNNGALEGSVIRTAVKLLEEVRGLGATAVRPVGPEGAEELFKLTTKRLRASRLQAGYGTV